MAAENIPFNILEHDLVPQHRLLTKEEADEVLEKLKIKPDQLPKIRQNDEIIKVLDEIEKKNKRPKIEVGRIVEVVRKSRTAEEFIAYRLVTES